MLNNSVNHTDHCPSEPSAPIISDLKPVMTGLLPAFRDKITGEIHLSLDNDGQLSQDHSFCKLPMHWVCESSPSGEAMTLIPTIEAGYWRHTGFIAIRKYLQLPLDS